MLRTVLLTVILALIPAGAYAYISQVDGTVLPAGPNMQQCLDRPITGEGVGVLDASEDALVLPEAFRPVEDPVGSGRYPVTFRMIGEGAGFLNIFGYYYVDEDVTDPSNLHMVFDCRTGGICACPCEPTDMRRSDGSPQSWERTLDFSTLPGFAPGRAIGFFIRTPELLSGGSNNTQCGGAAAVNNDHRTYFTSRSLNDDGDFVHFLIYDSITYNNTYYFGFEDLFRGGDNDFEDVLARVTGLVPTCTPQLESCNGQDDDCDLNVDEGLTQACSSACGAGVRICSGGSYGACSAATPAAESCDNSDNDCDTRIDEGLSRACSNSCGAGTEICVAGAFVGCTARAPTIETCDGSDEDCDTRIDEMLSRSCTTACGAGTETCSGGSYGGCTAPTPVPETCNGADDNCNGLTDEGLSRACSSACGNGSEVCIAGEFVGCTAPVPTLEACNGLDDDCDGRTDEELTRTCSTACGNGSEACMEGAWAGCDAPLPADETCNNIDDDCDGVIDDGNPGGGAFCLPDALGGFTEVEMGMAGDRCVPGNVVCVSGMLECRGATSPSPEICNCEDDDCDGRIDEETGAGAGLCPGDGACVACACLTPCANAEFPCPPGRECDTDLARPEIDVRGYCVAGMCEGVECTEQEICEPTTGTCRNLCENISCPEGRVCVRGGCVEDNCYGRGCDAGQRCFGGECEADPCLDVSCATGFCREGVCTETCDVLCPAGERCDSGACEPEPCGGCRSDESCLGGECVRDECAMSCGPRRMCEGASCVDDPCSFVDCPAGTECIGYDEGVAQCTDPEATRPATPELGLASGGGGCACNTAGSASSLSLGQTLVVLFLLLGLMWRRRDRKVKGLARFVMTMLLALPTSGCEVEPFCLDNCGEDSDAGMMDMGRPDLPVTDGCVAVEESCDGEDNDCDGLVDEDYEFNSDPRHCGMCSRTCILPGAFPGCAEGVCVVERCEIGSHDLDGNGTNGCEYACLETGDELCDARDNDCDGNTDEGFELENDVGNCGLCGNVCAFNNASASCEDSVCQMETCNAGFVDVNGDPSDGCELACTATGVETCNGADDDCDTRIDEGFDLSSDREHCGRCGVTCSFVNAVGACVDSVCGVGACAAGFVDVDGLHTTGCEYRCTPTGSPDTCNGVDDDCDGRVDEADPAVGGSCGTSAGACMPGTQICQRGGIICIGGRGSTPETCDGVDEDCDGRTDETTAAAPIPGVGARCGETNVGRCAYGGVVCTGGTLSCGGAVVSPRTEICNGIDDNCNGVADDGATPPAALPPTCTQSLGECAGRTPECHGAAGWSCSFPDTYQTVETRCDGLDNDCDGTVDEGCLSALPASDVRIDIGDSSGANNSVQPFVVGRSTNEVFTAWMDLRGGGRARIYFARSSNNGNSFLLPQRIDTSGGAAIGPRIALVGSGTVNNLWADFRGGTAYREIMRRRSTNDGALFGSADRLNTGMNTDSFNIEVAVSGTHVYVVYESFTSSRNRHVFLLRSSNSGSSFSSPMRIDHGDDVAIPGFVAATPQISVSGADVHIVWRDNRAGALNVYYSRSTNNGASFSADRRLDRGAGASFAPSIVAEGANVYVVWVDDRSGTAFDINFARSTNRGASFSSAISIDDDPLPHDSMGPVVVSPAPGELVVGWVDQRFGFADIIVRHSDSAGASFDSAVRLDTGTAPGTSGSFDVSLAASGGLVGAAWSDDRMGLLDIHGNFSLDGGATWQPNDVRLDSGTAGTRDSTTPHVAVASGAVHVVWVDNRSGGANGDIYYRRMGRP